MHKTKMGHGLSPLQKRKVLKDTVPYWEEGEGMSKVHLVPHSKNEYFIPLVNT